MGEELPKRKNVIRTEEIGKGNRQGNEKSKGID
jgi:hypothetical protein